MSGQLAGLRVLVTRPAERADTLVNAVRAEGGDAVKLPLLAIEALDPVIDAQRIAFARRCIDNLQRYQHLIFISTNAVGYAMAWIKDRWSQLPHDGQYHAIGTATAEAMHAAGLPVAAVATAMNSESLLREPALAELTDKRVLIFRGIGGREFLGERLRQRGAEVDYAECYRRVPLAVTGSELVSMVNSDRVNCLSVSSGETLAVLAAAADRNTRQLPLVVPSQRVAAYAADYGFSRVVVAANAGVAATLNALREIREHREFPTS